MPTEDLPIGSLVEFQGTPWTVTQLLARKVWLAPVGASGQKVQATRSAVKALTEAILATYLSDTSPAWAEARRLYAAAQEPMKAQVVLVLTLLTTSSEGYRHLPFNCKVVGVYPADAAGNLKAVHVESAKPIVQWMEDPLRNSLPEPGKDIVLIEKRAANITIEPQDRDDIGRLLRKSDVSDGLRDWMLDRTGFSEVIKGREMVITAVDFAPDGSPRICYSVEEVVRERTPPPPPAPINSAPAESVSAVPARKHTKAAKPKSAAATSTADPPPAPSPPISSQQEPLASTTADSPQATSASKMKKKKQPKPKPEPSAPTHASKAKTKSPTADSSANNATVAEGTEPTVAPTAPSATETTTPPSPSADNLSGIPLSRSVNETAQSTEPESESFLPSKESAVPPPRPLCESLSPDVRYLLESMQRQITSLTDRVRALEGEVSQLKKE